MKKTFVPVLVTLLFFCSTAFGAGGHGRLNGKWACDGAASAPTPPLKKVKGYSPWTVAFSLKMVPKKGLEPLRA